MKATNLEEAVTLTKKFTTKPSNEALLQLYSWYKQATEGDITGDRPGGFDFVAAAKYNAWHNKKGESKEAATETYINLVNELAESHL